LATLGARTPFSIAFQRLAFRIFIAQIIAASDRVRGARGRRNLRIHVGFQGISALNRLPAGEATGRK
jgi:hypothetical protein